MDYRKIIELAILAKQYDLLPDPAITNLLIVANAFDDDELLKDAELYITHRIIEKTSSGYREEGMNT